MKGRTKEKIWNERKGELKKKDRRNERDYRLKELRFTGSPS
jgi:hypothetical protein